MITIISIDTEFFSGNPGFFSGCTGFFSGLNLLPDFSPVAPDFSPVSQWSVLDCSRVFCGLYACTVPKNYDYRRSEA